MTLQIEFEENDSKNQIVGSNPKFIEQLIIASFAIIFLLKNVSQRFLKNFSLEL